jgi:predicted DNA-binding transcriptional regulator AlpA
MSLQENLIMDKETSYSVIQFCKDQNMSRGMFYKILKKGLGPKIMKIGRLTRISSSAITEWRKYMEEKSVGKLNKLT